MMEGGREGQRTTPTVAGRPPRGEATGQAAASRQKGTTTRCEEKEAPHGGAPSKCRPTDIGRLPRGEEADSRERRPRASRRRHAMKA